MHLIKMDIYRMLKSKGMWIIYAIYSCMVILLELSVVSNGSLTDNFKTGIQNGNFIILGTIFTVYMCNIYLKKGYMKNLGSIFSGKNNIYIYHTIAALFFYVILSISNIILTFIIDLVFYGKCNLNINLSNLCYMFLICVMMSVYSLMICCVTLFTKNSVISIGFGLIYYMFIEDSIFSLLSEVFKCSSVRKMGIVHNISSLDYLNFDADSAVAVFGAIFYCVIVLFLGRIFIYKKEIY